MSESSLSVSRADILQTVGDFFTYGRNQFAWTREEAAQVNRVIKSGERRFLFAHPWRFLKPNLSLSLVASTATYDLPDDFAEFLSPGLSFAQANNKLFPVRLTSMERILELRQLGNVLTSIQPEYAAVTPKTFDGSTGERFSLTLFPTPAASGTLTAPYQSLPNATTDAAPYPMGGGLHSETIMASCLAAAELERDKKPGACKQTYDELLAKSIDHDRRGGPKILGYNGDADWSWQPHLGYGESLTYNGGAL